MYRDNTLVPREAVRLLALGLLATQEMTYAHLAAEVRYFTTHVVGPSLDLVASPVELLKVEGLVAAAEDAGANDDQESLSITPSGRAELDTLLKSNVRPGISDINKLIITLKIRFLHLLEAEDRELQIEMIAEMFERQLVRLTELRAHEVERSGNLSNWLDHEIAQTRDSVTWFESLRIKFS